MLYIGQRVALGQLNHSVSYPLNVRAIMIVDPSVSIQYEIISLGGRIGILMTRDPIWSFSEIDMLLLYLQLLTEIGSLMFYGI